MISTLLIVAGVILVTAASVLIFCVLSAPEGHEDSSGFHDHSKRSLLDQARRSTRTRRRHRSPALTGDLHLPAT